MSCFPAASVVTIVWFFVHQRQQVWGGVQAVAHYFVSVHHSFDILIEVNDQRLISQSIDWGLHSFGDYCTLLMGPPPQFLLSSQHRKHLLLSEICFGLWTPGPHALHFSPSWVWTNGACRTHSLWAAGYLKMWLCREHDGASLSQHACAPLCWVIGRWVWFVFLVCSCLSCFWRCRMLYDSLCVWPTILGTCMSGMSACMAVALFYICYHNLFTHSERLGKSSTPRVKHP